MQGNAVEIGSEKLSLRELRFLLVMMQTHQLSAAARLFQTSISTMSRTLARIRTVLGDPLFVHSGNVMVPTPKMETLAHDIAQILQMVDHLGAEDVFRPAAIQTALHIMSADNGLNAYLNAAIPHIQAAAPQAPIIIEPLEENYLNALRQGPTMLAIYPCSELPADFHSLELPSMHLRLLMRKGHPLETRWKKTGHLAQQDLDGYPRIFAYPLTAYRAGLREFENRLSLEGKADLYLPYFNAAVPILLTSDYVMWCPDASAKVWAETGLLTSIATEEQDRAPAFTPRLIWHDRMHLDPTCQWLRGMIVSHARESNAA